jgi:hypothetical protein
MIHKRPAAGRISPVILSAAKDLVWEHRATEILRCAQDDDRCAQDDDLAGERLPSSGVRCVAASCPGNHPAVVSPLCAFAPLREALLCVSFDSGRL